MKKKTLTDCILWLILYVALILACVIFLILDVMSHRWWWVVFDATLLVSFFLARITYRKALEYEAILVNQFKMMSDLMLMDKLASAISTIEPQKEKEDEVEADNGTPV